MEKSQQGNKHDKRSGEGDNSIVPEEIKGWSWGAFFLPFIWGPFNGNWWAIISIIPFLGLLVSVLLGIKGRKWAWQDKKWESPGQYMEVQSKWDVFGVIFFFLGIILYFAN